MDVEGVIARPVRREELAFGEVGHEAGGEGVLRAGFQVDEVAVTRDVADDVEGAEFGGRQDGAARVADVIDVRQNGQNGLAYGAAFGCGGGGVAGCHAGGEIIRAGGVGEGEGENRGETWFHGALLRHPPELSKWGETQACPPVLRR